MTHDFNDTVSVLRDNADAMGVRCGGGCTLELIESTNHELYRKWLALLFGSLRTAGLDGMSRSTRLGFLSYLFGRPLYSSNELYFHEVQAFAGVCQAPETHGDLHKIADMVED